MARCAVARLEVDEAVVVRWRGEGQLSGARDPLMASAQRLQIEWVEGRLVVG